MIESAANGQVTPAALESILRKYLVEHSSRRLNYLHWNAADTKDTTLCFVNLSGKELTRVNNSDLVFRVVRVKNLADWAVIINFITNFIVNKHAPKAAYTIRLDYLFSYLKSIKFNLELFTLTPKDFGVAYCNDEDPDKRKPVYIIDNDIQSLFLIDQLYTRYRKMLYSDISDWQNCRVTDILDDYLNNSDFRFKVDELGVTIPVTEALDVASRKFVTNYKNSGAVCKLEQVFINNAFTTVANRFVGADIGIVTVRVYLQLFLKKFVKSKK
jgi:hypothetical protein